MVPPLVTAEWEDALDGSYRLNTLLGPEETDLWDCDRIPCPRRLTSGGWLRWAVPWFVKTSCRTILSPNRLNPMGWVFGGLVGWLLFVV